MLKFLGKGVKLAAIGVGFPIALLSQASHAATVVVSAAADVPTGAAGAMMTIRVNGQAVTDPIEVKNLRSAGYQQYTVNTKQPVGAGSVIDVQFTNDGIVNGQDRNLYVEWVKVDGTQILPGATNVTLDKGDGDLAFDGLDVIPGQAAMGWNGALRFSITSSPVTTIAVEAAGSKLSNVGPKMEVRVNGVLAQPMQGSSPIEVTNLKGTWSTYQFTSTAPWIPGSVLDVVYLNDARNTSITPIQDRNLYVNSVTVNGVKRPIATGSVSPGTYFDKGDSYASATDGIDVEATAPGFAYWSGALRIRAGVNVPSVTEFSGKPMYTGPMPIRIQSNQAISGYRISNPVGPCIVVGPGITNAEISNNEIGPCGTPNGADAQGYWNYGYGVYIQVEDPQAPAPQNIRIVRNYIHQVTSGIIVDRAFHPILIDRNRIVVRGPRTGTPQFKPVGDAMGGKPIYVSSTTPVQATSPDRTKVSCNVSDGFSPEVVSLSAYSEDHINLGAVFGTASAPVEVAYNKLRGGSGANNPPSSTGIILGDDGGQWQWAHHNIVTNVAHVGVTVVGGSNITLESNKVYNNYNKAPIFTGMAYYIDNLYPNKGACTSITVKNNAGYGVEWDGGYNQTVDKTYYADASCSVAASGNLFYGPSNPPPASFSPAIFNSVLPCDY